MSIFKAIGHAVAAVGHAIGSAASAVAKWFSGAWTWVKTDGADIAVAILEEVKVFAGNSSTGFLAEILSQLTKSKMPTEILDELKKQLPNALAVSLAIQGLPDNATDEDIEDFEKRILAAFGVSDDKSEFYSTLGAKIIAIIRSNTMPGQKFTFAMLVKDLEAAYQVYLSAKEQDAAAA